MKIARPIVVILLGIFSFSACEKDDICVDGDTPLMIVGFYDANDPTTAKAVTALRVAGLGKTTTVDTFTDRADLDSIAIPLNPATTEATFILISNSATSEEGAETGNLDTLRLTYGVDEEFVSRACGFVARYNTLNTDFFPGSESWIREVTIENPIVENPITTLHVKILH